MILWLLCVCVMFCLFVFYKKNQLPLFNGCNVTFIVCSSFLKYFSLIFIFRSLVITCLVSSVLGMEASLFLLPAILLCLIYVTAPHQVLAFNRLLATAHENIQGIYNDSLFP